MTNTVQQKCTDVKPSCSKDTVAVVLMVEPETELDEIHNNSESVIAQEMCQTELQEVDVNYYTVTGDQDTKEDEEVEPQKKKKKSVKERMIEEIKTGREERNKILQGLLSAKQMKRTNTTAEHPVNMFFSSMAEVVKTLPPHLIAEARMKVCQVVSELECRALQQQPPPVPVIFQI